MRAAARAAPPVVYRQRRPARSYRPWVVPCGSPRRRNCGKQCSRRPARPILHYENQDGYVTLCCQYENSEAKMSGNWLVCCEFPQRGAESLKDARDSLSRVLKNSLRKVLELFPPQRINPFNQGDKGGRPARKCEIFPQLKESTRRSAGRV